MAASGRPDISEYGAYFERYVRLAATHDIVGALSGQVEKSTELLRGVPERVAGSAYAPGKWSLKEVLGHVTDTERIFAYRAMRFARNDKTELAGFDQDGYMPAAGFNRRRWHDLIAEFESTRRANLLLFGSFDCEAWLRSGIASQCTMSVRALAYCIAGHELHHMQVIEAAVREHAE